MGSNKIFSKINLSLQMLQQYNPIHTIHFFNQAPKNCLDSKYSLLSPRNGI